MQVWTTSDAVVQRPKGSSCQHVSHMQVTATVLMSYEATEGLPERGKGTVLICKSHKWMESWSGW